jgi:hypothetical protein
MSFIDQIEQALHPHAQRMGEVLSHHSDRIVNELRKLQSDLGRGDVDDLWQRFTARPASGGTVEFVPELRVPLNEMWLVQNITADLPSSLSPNAISNLVRNPSFEYDTVGSAPAWWGGAVESGAGGVMTATVSNNWAASGTKSFRLTLTVTSSTGATQGYVVSPLMPVTGDTTYQFQFTIDLASATAPSPQVYGYIAYNDRFSNTTYTPIVSTSSGTVQTLSSSSTSPASAVNAFLVLAVNSNAAGSGVVDCYFDDIMVTSGPANTPYADGDSLGYIWTGVPGNSVSTGGAGNLRISNDSGQLIYGASITTGNPLVKTDNIGGGIGLMPGEHLTVTGDLGGQVSIQVIRREIPGKYANPNLGPSHEMVSARNTHPIDRDFSGRNPERNWQPAPPDIVNAEGRQLPTQSSHHLNDGLLDPTGV